MVSAWEVFSIFQQRFLLFILKESPIFFSCETCFRGALLIKSKNSNDKIIPMNKKYGEQLIL